MPKKPLSLGTIERHKFSVLLFALFLFLAVNPFFKAIDESISAVVFNVFVFVVLIGNSYSVTHQVRSLLIAGVIAGLTISLFIYSEHSGDRSVEVYAYLLLGLIWLYSSGSILKAILTTRDVTMDTISGSVCVYLQIGLIWAIAFYFIETFLPGSFSFSTVPLTASESSRAGFDTFIYYSFVTLTTLGYGELLPVSEPARAFSYLETALGQVYLAVLVARLLGLHLAQKDQFRTD